MQSAADDDVHRPFMQQALEQARLALEAGNLPIGAVIVHRGEVVATGCNAIDTPPDDTHHAELRAMQSIAPWLASHKHECTLYTTLEPCMMCLGAMLNVGIESLAIAAPDRYVGALGLLDAGEYYRAKAQRLQIVRGVLADQSQALLDEYVRRTGHRTHLAAAQG